MRRVRFGGVRFSSFLLKFAFFVFAVMEIVPFFDPVNGDFVGFHLYNINSVTLGGMVFRKTPGKSLLAGSKTRKNFSFFQF
jgi:hypothetical protein